MMRFVARAASPRPAFLAVAEYLDEVEKKQFESEGAYSGNPWSGLKEATKKAKDKSGQTRGILRATDSLYKALTRSGDRNQKLALTKTMMIKGVKDPVDYGEIHMKPSGKSHVQRKPVDLTSKNRVVVVKIIQRWIVGGVPGRVPSA
jgi:hypothetical protein